MEQFRQRVAATCHIGPLDQEETKLYIEHRLKCAGSTGKPTFEQAAFDGIYKASAGIPRRINAIADRLLLAGFLSGRSHLTADDVKEVVNEFQQENGVPAKPAVMAVASRSAEASQPSPSRGSLVLDVDLTKIKLDSEEAEGMSRQIAQLAADQRGDQLQRLERSLLRLERINVQTLAMLQKLVNAVKKPDEGAK
jgi:hypothetical protein